MKESSRRQSQISSPSFERLRRNDFAVSDRTGNGDKKGEKIEGEGKEKGRTNSDDEAMQSTRRHCRPNLQNQILASSRNEKPPWDIFHRSSISQMRSCGPVELEPRVENPVITQHAFSI